MRRGAWGGLLLIGCSGAVSPDPASSDSPGEREAAEAPQVFSCAFAGESGKVRVEVEATNRWTIVDAQGADHSQDLGATSAVYVIEPSPTKAHPERAQVILEALTQGDRLAENQNAWASAVQAGWTKLNDPFLLQHGGASEWRRSSESGCDSGDDQQSRFLEWVGRTVDLTSVPEDLATSLDGLENGERLAIPLPKGVKRKIGIAEGEPIVARSEKPGYPATFVATHEEDRVVETKKKAADGTETKVPMKQHVEVAVTFTVDQRCHLVDLSRTDRSATHLFEGLPSLVGFSRTFHWRFTGLGS